MYDYNAYYNADDTDTGGTNDMTLTNDGESKNELFCWSKNHITNPNSECVPLAVTTKESPHADMCSGATETALRGINAVTQLTRVTADFVAPYLERTIEAEDSAALTYNFVAPAKGTYQFWFKVTAADTDSNSLSYKVGNRGKQIVRFAYPDITSWNKGKLDLRLDAGMHTVTVVKREAGIVLDEVFITNDPAFVSP